MAKFSGKVGYGESTEVSPGVWEDVITERHCYGDAIRDSRHLDAGDKVNDDVSVNAAEVSVVADAYMQAHFFAIRYVLWNGVRWKAIDVENRRPRLIIRMGGVYNGPTP